MSRAHELAPRAVPGATSPPNLHEDALAPPHPYPGWQPSGAGDPAALLAWIDHDLKGHDPVLDAPPRRAGTASHEQAKGFAGPVKTGLDVAEHVDTANAIVEKLGVLTNPGAKAASTGLGVALGPVGIIDGAMDIAEGIDEIHDGRIDDGLVHAIEGTLGIGSGGAAMGAIVNHSLLDASLVLTAGKAGMQTGEYGNAKVKELGWLHDSDGNAETASQWAGHAGRATDDFLTEHGCPLFGHVLGPLVTAGATIPAAAIDVAAAADGAGRSLGRALAHHARVKSLEHHDGFNISHADAEGVADYEEAAQRAVERSQREHPELWGHAKKR